MTLQFHQNIFSLVRNQFSIWWILALICTSILFFNACTTDDYDQPTLDERIVLNLKLNTTPLSTRSNESSETVKDKEGTELENQINNEDLWIAAFDPDNRQRIEILCNVGENDKTVSIVIKNFENYSDNIQIIALANLSRFGITKENLESVTDLSELSELNFSFDPKNLTSNVSDNSIDYYPLPMYGYTTYSFNSDSNEINIGMNRELAKIEIVDNLQGDLEIKSATLVKYSTESYLLPKSTNISEGTVDSATSVSESSSTIGNNLIFNKTTDESNVTTFYAYIPEINLGAADSDFRKIELTLTNDKKSEIRLINYSDGIPSTEPDEKWQSLNRNHIYRFNVKELTSTEPEIQIQPTIRICWYETDYGKFNSYNRDVLLLSDNNSDNILNPDNTDAIRVSDKIIINGKEIPGVISYYIECELEGDILFNDVIYILNEDGNLPVYYEDYARYLHLDVIKYENIEETTYCWLNSLPYANIEYANTGETNFSNKNKHRIYWRGDTYQTYKVELTISSHYEGTIVPLSEKSFQYDKNRDLYYYDFIVNGESVPQINCDLRNIIRNVTITPYSFSPETINGEEYYVFYAN